MFFRQFLNCYLVLLHISVALWQTSSQFVVKIAINDRVRCAGTVVADNFVVTAAHCIEHVKLPNMVTIVGGIFNPNDVRSASNASKIMRPGEYDSLTMNRDVAVIKLGTPLNTTSIKPIGLCTNGWQHGDPVQIYDFNNAAPRNLRTVNLNVVGRNKCAARYRLRRRLTKTMFCAAAASGNGCYSATGGPVLVHGEFCGIISSPAGCATQDSPAILTNIQAELKFIRDNMQK